MVSPQSTGGLVSFQPPHPIPYQGSKRKLAPHILEFYPARVPRLVEAFAGSAALTLSAATRGLASKYVINDSLAPLAELWSQIIENPHHVADSYESLWRGQIDDPATSYRRIRRQFNTTAHPIALLYLLARCVKAAVRFNAAGQFNQSADNRRLGAHPDVMRSHLCRASTTLRGRTSVHGLDYRDILDRVVAGDVVYLDPPYLGTSNARDSRYHQGINFAQFLLELDRLNSRNIPYALSFDGRSGDKSYGQELPTELHLVRIEIVVGRSSQATLNGRNDITIESLYLSPALAAMSNAQAGTLDLTKRTSSQLAMGFPAP